MKCKRNEWVYSMGAVTRAFNKFSLPCINNNDKTMKFLLWSRVQGKKHFMNTIHETIVERQRILLSKDRSFHTIEKLVRHDTGTIWEYPGLSEVIRREVHGTKII